MFSEIFKITQTVLISIYASLINTNSRLTINIDAFLIDSKNNGNNCEKDWNGCILVIRYQEIIKSNASLFSVNNIYKYIRSIYFWLPHSIIFIFTFAGTTSGYIFIICTFSNIFTISLNKKLVHVFLSSKDNICQYRY